MRKFQTKTLQKIRFHAFNTQAGRCFYCNLPMWTTQLENFCIEYGISHKSAQLLKCTAEHVIARQDGGTNQRTNIVAACLHCNRTRHLHPNALSSEEYKAHVTQLMIRGEWHPALLC